MPAPGQPENASFPGEFVPSASGKNCDVAAGGWGTAMTSPEYIWYGNMDQSRYPSDACTPYYHSNGKIDNFTVTQNITINGTIISTWLDGQLATARALPAKPFDIKHPSKENHRLRHVSLEGPEIAVYFRGKLENTNVIQLPDYWEELINPETITVNLTSIGLYQELFVEKIEWGKNIIVKNREGGAINCYYTVYAERKDLEKLIVEYEGETLQDYPGQDFIGIKELGT
jgi:hypothetical protein